MKRGEFIFIFILLLISAAVMLAGCGSRQGRASRPDAFRGGFQRNDGTDEQMQHRFEERQQVMLAACEGKSEGDLCSFGGLNGNMNGSCRVGAVGLLCESERQGRRIP